MNDVPYQHPVPGLDAFSRGIAMGTIARAEYLAKRLGNDYGPISNPLRINPEREDRDDDGVRWAARALVRDMLPVAHNWTAEKLADAAEWVTRAAGLVTVEPDALDDTGQAITGIRDPDIRTRPRPDDYSLRIARAVYEDRNKLPTEIEDRITYLTWIARALRRDMDAVGTSSTESLHLALYRAGVMRHNRAAITHLEAAWVLED